MRTPTRSWLRHILPWTVSAVALVYVFGFAIDWEAIPEATAKANLPLFVGITVADKIAFFLVWGLLQAMVIRRFVEPVSTRRVIAVKGAAELIRTVNNSLADGAFLLGVGQLARGRTAAVAAAASIPFFCHFGVLLVQATFALPFVPGGPTAYPGIAAVVLIGWLVVGVTTVLVRLGYWARFLKRIGLGILAERISPTQMLPIAGWFVVFAVFDVLIQGLASRAFGVAIDWSALAAGIPVLYFVISIPSLGNFGTREIAWANLFAEYGTRAELTAFALWTNVIFLVMHVLIGVAFFSRGVALLRELRRARREGVVVPERLLRDASDP